MSAELSNSPRPAGESPRPLGEIAQGPGGFELFLDRNQKKLFVLAIVLALAAVVLVIYRGIEESREKTAGAALSQADDLGALQGVIKNHHDTTAAGSAAVLLADRQWQEGDQDAAIATLREFIAQHPNHAARPTAQASLATKLAAQGNPDEARSLFRAVADDPSSRFLAPYALISLGDLERAAGDLEAAKANYERARNDFPGSNFTETATRRLTILNAAVPVEIDPPPAPPESGGTPSPSVPPMLAPRSGPTLDAGSPFAPAPSSELAPESELPEVPPAQEAPSDEGSSLESPTESPISPDSSEPAVESIDTNSAVVEPESSVKEPEAPAEP